MATETCLDLRRKDLRNVVQPVPMWVASAPITPDADDLGALLVSFPTNLWGSQVYLHSAMIEVVTAFAGGTLSLLVGEGTLATDAITTGGLVTIVDADEISVAADVTMGTAGIYPVVTGSDCLTLWAAGKLKSFTPADATVPCIYATLTSDAAITAGALRVHLLLSVLP